MTAQTIVKKFIFFLIVGTVEATELMNFLAVPKLLCKKKSLEIILSRLSVHHAVSYQHHLFKKYLRSRIKLEFQALKYFDFQIFEAHKTNENYYSS